MDASQYKGYYSVALLFMKYVTDKFKGVKYADITVPDGGNFDDLVALKGSKNIGEEMDKVIAKPAEASNKNRLRERDICKSVTTFNQQIKNDSKYACFVPHGKN